MYIAKIFLLCTLIVNFGLLRQVASQDIKIVDFAAEGPYEVNIIHIFDDVTFLFLIKNCGKDTIDELQISATAGERNTITQHPVRLIRGLEPGKTHTIRVELSSEVGAPMLEVFLEIAIGEKTFFASERVFFDREYRPQLDHDNIACEYPRVHLRDFGYPSLKALDFWFDNTMHTYHIKIPSIQQSRQRYRRTGYLLGATGLAAAGVGAYFHFQANDLYTNEYKTATADATQIHKDILSYEQRSHYLLGAALPLLAISTYSAIKQIRLNRQINLLLTPTADNGAVVSLNYTF